MNDRGSIGRPPDRFRAQECDVASAELAGRIRVADERRDELAACYRTQEPAFDDRGPEPQEDRLVQERLESMAGDGGDEDVDRIRAEIDGCADDRPG